MDTGKSSKLKRLRDSFPELPEDTCLDTLECMNWDVEAAITVFGGKPGLNLSPEEELSDWPKLSEATRISDKNLARRVSGSSTPDKPMLNRQRSLGSSPSPRSSPFDRFHYTKKNEEPNSQTASWRGDFSSRSSIDNITPTEVSVVEPILKTFPLKSNHEQMNQALRTELMNPEQRKILLLASAQPGRPTPRLLVLMRGVPGSGKSRLASLIVGVSDNGVSVSADDYFINHYGRYCFNPQNLGAAHEQARLKCLKSMESSITPIVVDNTNTEAWEMLPYVKLAMQYDYEIHLVEPSTTWKRNANILATKTLHSVPKQKISEMLRRFQQDITVPKLLDMAYREGMKSSNGNNSKQAHKLMKKNFFHSAQSGKGDKSAPQYFASGEPLHPVSHTEPSKIWNPIKLDNFGENANCTEGAASLPSTSNHLHSSHTKNDFSLFPIQGEVYKAAELPYLSSLKIEGEEDENSASNSRLAAIFPQFNELHDLASPNNFGLTLIQDNYSSGEPSWPTSSFPDQDFRDSSERPLSLVDIESEALHKRVSDDVDRLLFDDGAPDSLSGSVETDETPSSSSEQGASDVKPSSDISIINNIFDSHEIQSFGRSNPAAEFENSMPPKRDGANILQNLFPSVPQDELDDIFFRCDGDLTWCTSLLIDGGYKMDGAFKGSRVSGLSFTEAGAFTAAPPRLTTSVAKPKKKKNGGKRSSSTDEDFSNPQKVVEQSSYNPSHLTNAELLMTRSSPFLDTPAPSPIGLKGHSPFLDATLGAIALPASSHDAGERADSPEDIFEATDGEDWFDMELPPDFVNQLMEMYTNPFGLMDAHNLPKENLKIRIPPKMAFEMFQLFFLNTIQRSNLGETTEEGSGNTEEEVENQKLIEDLINMDYVTSSTVPDFQKLMELEIRLTARDQKYITDKRKEIQQTMASKLTLEKLQTAFPTLSLDTIQDVYAQNSGKYQETLRALKTLYGPKFSPEGLTENFLEASRIIRTSVLQEVETIENTTNAVGRSRAERELTAQEWRARAMQHYYLREQYRNKVQEMFNNGMGPEVSGYYTQLAKLHQNSMFESNRRAAELIVGELTRKHGSGHTLDLHHLFVTEALQRLYQYLREKRDYLENSQLKKLELRIIVGKGNNSHGGPRVSPAVIDFLRKNHYSFVVLSGIVVVTLHPKARDNGKTVKF